MYCSKCGKEQQLNAKFCEGCGNSISTTVKNKLPKQKNYSVTYSKVTSITFIILLVIFIGVGSFSEEIVEPFIGTVIISLMIGFLFTIVVREIIKWKHKGDTDYEK